MLSFTEEQQKFIDASGMVVLQACPGSGKTAVAAKKLLDTISNWNKPHQGIAVLSFTNVASKEIEKQASEMIVGGCIIDYPHFVGTLDSFINSFFILRFGYLMMERQKRPTIAFKNIFTLPQTFWRAECYQNGCPEKIDEFRWGIDGSLFHKKDKVTCAPNSNRKHPPCYECKQGLLKKGLIFQSDVAALASMLIKKYPSIGRAVAERFPVIILDEAQDTSIEQMAVLDAIIAAGVQAAYLVGDPDQSIYEWREATPECFIQKMEHPGWSRLKLSANFRSSQLICNATRPFAKTHEFELPSTAKGADSQNSQKPVLILYNDKHPDIGVCLIEEFMNL